MRASSSGAARRGSAPGGRAVAVIDGPDSAYAWRRLAASLALSTLGGIGLWSVVVSLPAIPHLMAHGATRQHARIKALALVQGYLHELRAEGRLPAGRRPVVPLGTLPLAA